MFIGWPTYRAMIREQLRHNTTNKVIEMFSNKHGRTYMEVLKTVQEESQRIMRGKHHGLE